MVILAITALRTYSGIGLRKVSKMTCAHAFLRDFCSRTRHTFERSQISIEGKQKQGEEVRVIGEWLLLPDHDAQRGAGEEIRLAELVLQIFQVGRGDVFGMTDEEYKDRRFGGYLGDKSRLCAGRWFVLARW